MAWIESHLKGGGGGVELDTVLEGGQVSTTSAYATANFADISDYDFLFVKIYYDYDGVLKEYTSVVDVTQIVAGSNYLEIRIQTSEIGIFTVSFTKTSISGKNYGGAWRNIYADIKATNISVW